MYGGRCLTTRSRWTHNNWTCIAPRPLLGVKSWADFLLAIGRDIEISSCVFWLCRWRLPREWSLSRSSTVRSLSWSSHLPAGAAMYHIPYWKPSRSTRKSIRTRAATFIHTYMPAFFCSDWSISHRRREAFWFSFPYPCLYPYCNQRQYPLSPFVPGCSCPTKDVRGQARKWKVCFLLDKLSTISSASSPVAVLSLD